MLGKQICKHHGPPPPPCAHCTQQLMHSRGLMEGVLFYMAQGDGNLKNAVKNGGGAEK